MKILQTIVAVFVAAVITFAAMFFVIGAVMGIAAIVTEARPTGYEEFSMIMVMVLGGVIGAIWFREE